MIGYVDGTQASSILPRANVLANLEAIDNFFFIDAALVRRPAGRERRSCRPRVGASTNNLYTSSQVRLSPYFQGNIGQNIRWLVRSDQHVHVDVAERRTARATRTTRATSPKSCAPRRRSA